MAVDQPEIASALVCLLRRDRTRMVDRILEDDDVVARNAGILTGATDSREIVPGSLRGEGIRAKCRYGCQLSRIAANGTVRRVSACRAWERDPCQRG
jgi:hypothetical protein